jgi:hypothetical protein
MGMHGMGWDEIGWSGMGTVVMHRRSDSDCGEQRSLHQCAGQGSLRVVGRARRIYRQGHGLECCEQGSLYGFAGQWTHDAVALALFRTGWAAPTDRQTDRRSGGGTLTDRLSSLSPHPASARSRPLPHACRLAIASWRRMMRRTLTRTSTACGGGDCQAAPPHTSRSSSRPPGQREKLQGSKGRGSTSGSSSINSSRRARRRLRAPTSPGSGGSRTGQSRPRCHRRGLRRRTLPLRQRCHRWRRCRRA